LELECRGDGVGPTVVRPQFVLLTSQPFYIFVLYVYFISSEPRQTEKMLKLVLVRHGQAETNLTHAVGRNNHVQLTDKGKDSIWFSNLIDQSNLF
jgi:hypothetical protein